MFHKNQLVQIDNPEAVDPRYAKTNGILIGRINGFRGGHRVVFNKLIFLEKNDVHNSQIWVKFADEDFSFLQCDIKHKENKIAIPKGVIRGLSCKELKLYEKRFVYAEKHAKALIKKKKMLERAYI